MDRKSRTGRSRKLRRCSPTVAAAISSEVGARHISSPLELRTVSSAPSAW
ncbi:hypothetical protein [Streptomyces chartreusis]